MRNENQLEIFQLFLFLSYTFTRTGRANPPELINFPGGRSELPPQLGLSLPQQFDLPLGRHILPEQLQFVSLQLAELSLERDTLVIVSLPELLAVTLVESGALSVSPICSILTVVPVCLGGQSGKVD